MTEELFLYQEIQAIFKALEAPAIPEIIQTGLAPKIALREYQVEALQHFISYFSDKNLSKNKQIHNLFHMATGSGKTVIMASLILYLYSKGYRKFIFFVNQTNILEKTIENFTNNLSSKYLFNDDINYLGEHIKLKKVNNFSGNNNNDDIEILFTTTQKLHMDLSLIKENAISYNDFEQDKMVFISDESHHINSSTKKKSKDEVENENSWEYSVMRAFHSNKDNIMLEFTATADLKDKNVKQKYQDKIIYNYPLKDFRQSGYTKDFQNFSTNTSLWQRTLMALVLSEYRKYLFTDLKLNVKPILMLKSQKIKESEEFYHQFFNHLANLTSYELQDLYEFDNEILTRALDYFKQKDPTFELLEHSLQDSFAKEHSIIMNGASDGNKENQLKINSLEDEDNPIRFIFAVDMLNEGWDVLNLFDIVRLYDTRQGGKNNKPGNYTIKEAQLIGRGARYCPFQVESEQIRFKRKYDYDLDNPYRLLETMFFHSKDDAKYITELKQALIASGLQDSESIELEYKLKESFKDSDFFNQAIVFTNSREPKSRSHIYKVDEKLNGRIFHYNAPSKTTRMDMLFGENISNNKKQTTNTFLKFKDIDYHCLLSASEKFNELKFDVLQQKYPNLKSLKEFLTSEHYLGNAAIEITHSDKLTGLHIFKACIKACEEIARYILSIKPEYRGTTEFKPKNLCKILKDKRIYLSKIDDNGGIGASQNDSHNTELQLNLAQENWYVFNDNYGTSEEKRFIRYFNAAIKPKLEAKNLEFYVIRNERVADFAIYSFQDGERFEPDFLLFVKDKKTDKNQYTQAYIEPKGAHLLQQDKWKENFLNKIGKACKVKEDLVKMDDFKIIGLPFFNHQERMQEFNKAIDELLNIL